jgi:hypothetical protein
VLEVTVPKPERVSPRSISITVGSTPRAIDNSETAPAAADTDAPAQDGAEAGEPAAA